MDVRECVCFGSVTYAFSSINRYLALKSCVVRTRLSGLLACLVRACASCMRAYKMCYVRLYAICLSRYQIFQSEIFFGTYVCG